jgi:hypothetical protein
MNPRLTSAVVGCAWIVLLGTPTQADIASVLENTQLALRFDAQSGTLLAIHNKLTGETYQVGGDRFAVEAADFRLDFPQVKLSSLKQQGETLKAQYQGDTMTIDVTYTLAAERQFAEKQLILTCNRPYVLKKVILSRPTFSATDLRMISYRYPKFGRKPGEEPNCTCFGRTAQGGLFTGVEVPFDASSLDGQ